MARISYGRHIVMARISYGVTRLRAQGTVLIGGAKSHLHLGRSSTGGHDVAKLELEVAVGHNYTGHNYIGIII